MGNAHMQYIVGTKGFLMEGEGPVVLPLVLMSDYRVVVREAQKSYTTQESGNCWTLISKVK